MFPGFPATSSLESGGDSSSYVCRWSDPVTKRIENANRCSRWCCTGCRLRGDAKVGPLLHCAYIQVGCMLWCEYMPSSHQIPCTYLLLWYCD